MQRGQRTRGRDLENGAKAIRAAGAGSAIEIAVGTQGQAAIWIRPIWSGEVVECRDGTGGRALKNCAAAKSPSLMQRSVQISVLALRQNPAIERNTPFDRAVEIVQIGVGLRVEWRWCDTHDEQEHAAEHNRQPRTVCEDSCRETQAARWCHTSSI